MRHPTRRQFLGLAAALAGAALPRRAAGQASARVVVVGGGFAGVTCARFLHRAGGRLQVTLVEPNATFTACPFSNAVIAGLRAIQDQTFGYEAVRAEGVALVQAAATGIDPQGRTVRLADGGTLAYDRLVLAPGIDFRWDAIPGYGEAAAGRMPHAWKAGEQTLLLRRRLEAMADGGLVVIAAPANPFRCPPGPYERASLIAHYLKGRKPRAKLLLLDAKDSFSKQSLFTAAWKQLYPGLLEWVPLSKGGRVTAVDANAGTVSTEFEKYQPAVANIIPPQRAGRIADLAGVADRTGWCPIDPVTFESRLQPNVHVIGDAAIAGAMPKSAFAANAQAKVCALAVATLLRGEPPQEPLLLNTCYSLVAPDYGISVAGVYRPREGQLAEVAGAGGTSPAHGPPQDRALEARYAEDWFRIITHEVFG
ncbi:MAG TPA: FCSD flavin-binding domain-containing protein [Candidatus Sulfotelmatobacter sp.]|nr:FCSD flavin-binding domain-containing protein [Candidatus Sulfotelmatobacter sp.]